MDSFLILTAITLGIAVLIGFLNEKLFHQKFGKDTPSSVRRGGIAILLS